MDLDEQRRLARTNLTEAFDLARLRMQEPRGGRARFGVVDAVAVGVDAAFYNPVLALDPAATADDVRAAIAWTEARGLPVSVKVGERAGPAVRAAAESLGMVQDPWLTPVMVLAPIGPVPVPPPDVVIRAGALELLDDWHTVLGSRELFRRIFGSRLVTDPDVRLAVGYLDGEPVSAAAAIRSGDTLGIYAVATVERARRRGIGRAVTWAAIEAGRVAWHSSLATLQSSDLGVPVYRSMGFVEVDRLLELERPET